MPISTPFENVHLDHLDETVSRDAQLRLKFYCLSLGKSRFSTFRHQAATRERCVLPGDSPQEL